MRGTRRFGVFALLAVLPVLAQCAIQFEPVVCPLVDYDKSRLLTTTGFVIGESESISYNKLARTSEVHAGAPIGTLFDAQGKVLKAYNTTTLATLGSNAVSRQATGVSVFVVNKVTYFVYQFARPLPSAVYILQTTQSGGLQQVSQAYAQTLATAQWQGLWAPQTSTTTAWKTHLGVESVPDAYLLNSYQCYKRMGANVTGPCLEDDPRGPQLISDVLDYLRLIGYPQTYANQLSNFKGSAPWKSLNPYALGYVFEIAVDTSKAAGNFINLKHYAMGRTNAGGIHVMLDSKTVYMAGANGGLFMFISNTPQDLSAGTLYVAKIQYSGSGDASASVRGSTAQIYPTDTYTVSWIKLGSSSQTELANLISPSSGSFIDISSVMNVAPQSGSGGCKDNFTAISYNNGIKECVQVVNEKLAPFLETQRYAALKGATLDFFSFGGLTESTLAGKNKVYASVPSIAKDFGIPANDCGCIFEMSYNDSAIITGMRPITCGEDSADPRNRCNEQKIGNPSDIAAVSDYNIIIVGEESGAHANPSIWALDPDTGGIDRIATAPIGSAARGVGYFPNVGGSAYVTACIDHPYLGQYSAELTAKTGASPDINGTGTEAWLQYFGPLPIQAASAAMRPVDLPYDLNAYGEQSLIRGSNAIVVGEFRPVLTAPLVHDGDSFGKNITIGKVVDKSGNAVMALTPPNLVKSDNEEGVSHAATATGLLPMCDKAYSVVVYGDTLPAAMYVLPVQQKSSGELTVQDGVRSIADVVPEGLWKMGAGKNTPWNTFVIGEVDEPNANSYFASVGDGDLGSLQNNDPELYGNVMNFIRYFDVYRTSGVAALGSKAVNAVFQPYEYGWVMEVKVNSYDCLFAEKHYTLGRFSHGDVLVMDDSQTVYMTDAYNWGGFFKFVADKSGDLTSGTLYAANATRQGSGDTSTNQTYTIDWIKLGSASNTDLQKKLDNNITFSSIWDSKVPQLKQQKIGDAVIQAYQCPDGYTATYLYPAPVDAVDIEPECLKLKDGQDQAAAFFETRRYAAYLSATVEWNMASGLAASKQSATVYMAVPAIARRMADDDNDRESVSGVQLGPNYISGLRQNPCGCVFALQFDKSSFNINNMYPFVCGTGEKYDKTSSPLNFDANNQCAINQIAQPTALAMNARDNALLIGESAGGFQEIGTGDTFGHENAVVWAMDLGDLHLDRVISAPLDAEVTCVNSYPNVNTNSGSYGMDYTLFSMTGPYQLSHKDAAGGKFAFGNNGGVWYMGPVTPAGNATNAGDYTCYAWLDEGAAYSCPAGAQVPTVAPATPKPTVHGTVPPTQAPRTLPPTGVQLDSNGNPVQNNNSTDGGSAGAPAPSTGNLNTTRSSAATLSGFWMAAVIALLASFAVL